MGSWIKGRHGIPWPAMGGLLVVGLFGWLLYDRNEFAKNVPPEIKADPKSFFPVLGADRGSSDGP